MRATVIELSMLRRIWYNSKDYPLSGLHTMWCPSCGHLTTWCDLAQLSSFLRTFFLGWEHFKSHYSHVGNKLTLRIRLNVLYKEKEFIEKINNFNFIILRWGVLHLSIMLSQHPLYDHKNTIYACLIKQMCKIINWYILGRYLGTILPNSSYHNLNINIFHMKPSLKCVI